MAFAQVVFPERRPRNVGIFDYEIPANFEIHEGSLVVAPFRNQEKQGIVWSISSKPSIDLKKIKPLSSVIAPLPMITETQKSLGIWLSERTGSSLSTVANVLLQEKPKRAEYPDHQIEAKNKSSQTYSFSVDMFDRRKELYGYLKRILISITDQQVCIVCPDLKTVNEIINLVSLPQILRFTGKENATNRYTVWKKIWEGKPHIVVGTRNCLLLPFQHLQTIILLDEEDPTYQQEDQHPDIDARVLAQYAAQLYKAKLQCVSNAPTVETFITAKGEGHLRHHPSTENPKLVLINRNDFPQKKQSALLPQDLIDYISTQKKQTLLIYNRKGYARFIRCKDCSWSPVCTTCQSSFLVEQSKNGLLTCNVCQTTMPVPEQCPSCSGVSLLSVFPGIEALGEKIKHVLPATHVSVISKDKDNLDTISAQVVLLTQFGVQHVDWRSVGTAVFLDADLTLAFPDFRSGERLAQRVRYVFARLSHDATCFLLTRKPETSVLQSLAHNNILSWYAKETQDRKELRFPPFSELIKFSLVDPDMNQVAQKESALVSDLQNIFHQQNISGSAVRMQAIPHKKKNGFVSLVLAKVPPNTSETLTKILYERFGDNWDIRINPLDLQSHSH